AARRSSELADNLCDWLGDVGTRLGSLSQRLSASVGRARLDTASAAELESEGMVVEDDRVETSWLQIDNVFYEARGQAWALSHLLRAIEVDFADVLAKKNATISVRQIIRELEAAQEPLWSPMVLNGSGYGVLANHSLVMANYISRANAAIIDLRNLLSQGYGYTLGRTCSAFSGLWRNGFGLNGLEANPAPAFSIASAWSGRSAPGAGQPQCGSSESLPMPA